ADRRSVRRSLLDPRRSTPDAANDRACRSRAVIRSSIRQPSGCAPARPDFLVCAPHTKRGRRRGGPTKPNGLAPAGPVGTRGSRRPGSDGGVGTGVVRGVVIRGNVFINFTDPDREFAGSAQGIGCFDGFFEDWVIENNVVVVNHWHGITLLGARNVRVVNNTVVDKRLRARRALLGIFREATH